MAKTRAEISLDDQWNVAALFPSLAAWKESYDKINSSSTKPCWPDISSFKGRLGQNPETLREALEKMLAVSRTLSLLYTYAHLRHDEDIADDEHKVAYSKILATLNDFAEEMAWFEPELLSLSDETLCNALNSQTLAPYKFYLEKIIRIKKHMLSKEEEELLAMAGKALSSPHRAFSALSDADFNFGKVLDGQENEKELTHGLYGLYIRSQDRKLRENAFKRIHGTYQSYQNTLSELLNGQIQAHFFNAKARRYSSCLEAALFPKNIDTKVYHSLIQAVNDNLATLHRYVNLRKDVMCLDKLHLYDMYVPLLPAVDMRMDYKEAEDLVIASVAPLGPEYQNLLYRGFKEDRWVDRFENKSKRSGAYSSGCYDSMPYILMNYKELLKDVFTLAHEAGHSMHSLLSRKTQPYHYSDYPIFLAEVASTFNEELLMKLLLERAKTKEERAYLINEKIEDIRGTLFRQTMFAEFELKVHEMAEHNVPLTPKLLREEYLKLNQRYFGPTVQIDEEAEVEWARIPHFYYNFYVFQYATGISAALALSERVLKGGDDERQAYLSFLKGGSSRYPIDMLKIAGIDMNSKEPVALAIHKFDRLVHMLSQELNSKDDGVST